MTDDASSARLALSAGEYVRSLVVVGDGKAAALSTEMLALRIEALIKGGNFGSAEKMLAVIGGRPDAEPSLSRLQALLAIQQRDTSRAIAVHAAALAKRPGDEWHRIRLARAHVRNGAAPRAHQVLAEGLAARPHAVGLMIEDSSILRRTGQMAAAAERLAQAAAVQPESALLLRHRGELATAMGDHHGAAALHAEAMRREPHIPGHRSRLIRACERSGAFEESARLMAEGLERHPNSAPLLVENVRMHMRLGAFDEAAGGLGRLAHAYPDHGRVGELRAELAEAAGNHAAAAQQRRKQMRRFPNDPGCAVRLADGLRRQGNRDAALDILTRMAKPTSLSRMLASRLLIEQGRHDECCRILDSWASSGGDRVDGHRIAMRLASAEYRFADSGAAADAILAQRPDDIEACKAKALAATLSFDTDAAWGALKRVQTVPLGEGPMRSGGRRLRSLFGHIANEFRLRDDQSRQLAIRTTEGDMPLRREAAAILRDDPASLPAAFALLIAFARSGKLHAVPPPGAVPIPALLHQYWDRDLPDDVAALIGDTRSANADLAHCLWNDAAARAFLGEFDDDIYLQAYKRARHVAVKSDLLRLALLWRQGGYYMDADDLAVAPVSGLASPGCALLLYQERMASLGNNFMAARPGHPLIKVMLDQAAREIASGAGEAPWLTTGPGLISRVIAGALAQDRKALGRNAVRIVPLHLFRATVEAGRKADYKAGTRHWKRAG